MPRKERRISESTYKIMQHALDSETGSIYVYEAEKQLGVKKQTAFSVLKRLLKLGAVEQSIEKGDGGPSRVVYKVTAKGRLYFSERIKEYLDELEFNEYEKAEKVRKEGKSVTSKKKRDY